MTIKITRKVRAAIKSILDDSCEYDAATLRITADGHVTARKDADKTFASHDPMRYCVGHVAEMVTADGKRRPGY